MPLFQEDELGRNEEVFISSETDYTIRQIKPFKIEEKIFDWNTNDRISFEKLIKKYCIKKEMKSISTLHNKLVIQVNENFYVFSLKNIEDAHRLLETMENYYREHHRNDAIFVKDVSTTQRKWMYDLLVKMDLIRVALPSNDYVFKTNVNFVPDILIINSLVLR